MNYSKVILELLGRIEVLEIDQLFWYAEALDTFGNARRTIEKALHALIRGRQVYMDENKKYISRKQIETVMYTQKIEMELFWVLLDAMPASRDFIMNSLKMFPLSYVNQKQELVQVMYIPKGQERSICRYLMEVPEGEYAKEDVRIAVMEDPNGASDMKKVGFRYLVWIDHSSEDCGDRLQVLKEISKADAWEDLQ